MKRRQGVNVQGVTQLNGQSIDGVLKQLFPNKLLQIWGQLQLSNLGFDRNLPAAGRAEKQFISTLTNDLSSRGGQLRVIADPPQEGMGV